MLAMALPPAVAQDSDPRLVTRVYNATQVVKIHGRPGVQATIAFADDEKIENVAVGDSDKWQITPNKRANLLFARPLDAAAVTNMTVVTDKRTYLFDLVASAKDQPVYMLSFTYRDAPLAAPAIVAPIAEPLPVVAAAPQQVLPPTPRLAEAQPAQAEPYPEPQPLVTAPPAADSPAPPARSAIDVAIGAPVEDLPAGNVGLLAEANKPGDPAPVPVARPKREKKAKPARVAKPDPAPQTSQIAAASFVASPARPALPTERGALNFAWVRKGKSSLLPARIYDDGRATYLIWSTKQTVPAVVLTGPEGEQAPPEMTRQEHSLVILNVPSRIELRSGNASATLDNLRGQSSGVSLAGPLSSGQAGANR